MIKFPYQQVSSGVIRPIIPVKLLYADKVVLYEALIDSGADYCIFHWEVAEYLGLPSGKGEKIKLAGISGERMEVTLHKVEIAIESEKYEAKIGFSRELAPFAYGVLGQKGFFEFFIVKFVYQKEEIEITPKR